MVKKEPTEAYIDILINALTYDGIYKGDAEQQERIKAVADAYNTLVSKQPYHSHEQAVNFFKKSIGAPFDPKIIKAFMTVKEEFWVESVRGK